MHACTTDRIVCLVVCNMVTSFEDFSVLRAPLQHPSMFPLFFSYAKYCKALEISSTCCREICVARKRIESPSHSESASQQAAGEGGESAVFAQLEQAVAALLRLMTFCGLPSPWEAVNMLKYASTAWAFIAFRNLCFVGVSGFNQGELDRWS